LLNSIFGGKKIEKEKPRNIVFLASKYSNVMSKVVEIEFKQVVNVSSSNRINKGYKLKVNTLNDFPAEWEVKESLKETGFWKPEYNCSLNGTYSVVKLGTKSAKVKPEDKQLPFIRRVLYYSFGLIIPFVFAKPLIKLFQSAFSLEGILWKSGEKNNTTPIDDIPKYKRAIFGIILPWWALKMIFSN
jgi:hypothetical protein